MPLQMDEAPAAMGADRGLGAFRLADAVEASTDSPSTSVSQPAFDPLRILRLHWGISAADVARARAGLQ